MGAFLKVTASPCHIFLLIRSEYKAFMICFVRNIQPQNRTCKRLFRLKTKPHCNPNSTQNQAENFNLKSFILSRKLKGLRRSRNRPRKTKKRGLF